MVLVAGWGVFGGEGLGVEGGIDAGEREGASEGVEVAGEGEEEGGGGEGRGLSLALATPLREACRGASGIAHKCNKRSKHKEVI